MNELVFNLKRVMNSNFIFMSFVALFLGLIPIFSMDETHIENKAIFAQNLLRGYTFLFIVFSCELSKGLLQSEKISKKIEWMIANGCSVRSIFIKSAVVNYTATSILLMPLLLVAIYLQRINILAIVLDYFIYCFTCSLIISGIIMYTKNMNRLRSISFVVSSLYLLCIVLETVVPISILALGIKYLFSFILLLYLKQKVTRERVTSSYY